MAIYISYLATLDLLAGGNSWKQGDWLINDLAVDVRRGMAGTLIIRAAQALSVNPVAVVVGLQISMVLAITALLTAALRRFAAPATLWLLALSPGFFLSFWSLDDQGGLRKELIVFLAFAILLLSTTRPAPPRLPIYISALLYGAAVLSHEGNLFFAPFFALCFYLLQTKALISKADFIALLGIIISACLAAVVIALSHSTITNYQAVCAPVLAAGADPEICEGAIKVLEIPLSEYMTTTFWMFFSPRVLSFAALYALTSVTMLIIGSHLIGRALFVRAYIGSAFLFLPLYVVAVDWGRWVSFHTSAVIFTLLIALSLGVPKTANRSEIAAKKFGLLLVFSVIWGFSHFLDVLWGGIVWKMLKSMFQLIA